MFDECQVISSAAQSALLKELEEPADKTFFMISTTDPHKLLEPLTSRCLELEFTTAPKEIIVDRLMHLSRSTGNVIPDTCVNLIVSRSGGHFRNVDMMFDLFLILGEADFVESVTSAIPVFYLLIEAAIKQNKAVFEKNLEALRGIPVVSLPIEAPGS